MLVRVEDAGQKYQEGSGNDIPLCASHSRGCTDVVCLVAFIGHAILFWFLILGDAGGVGNPHNLYHPRDFRGEYCGHSDQWNSNNDLASHPSLVFSMNVTRFLDGAAHALVCAGEGQTFLTPQEYQQACGSSASTTRVPGAPQGRADAPGLGAGESGHLRGVMEAGTGYVNLVCAANCSLLGAAATRGYAYSPAPDAPWAGAWQKYRAHAQASGSPGLQAALAPFELGAWGYEACPYPPRYCVPVPGAALSGGANGVCSLGVDAAALSAVGAEFAGEFSRRFDLALEEATPKSLGSVVGDLRRTLDVFCLVSILSLVAALTFVVSVRFCARTVVWTSVLSVPLLLLAGGCAAVVRASQCADTSFLGSVLGTAHEGAACATKGGFFVQGKFPRGVLTICAYSSFALALVWVLMLMCSWNRIKSAIAANRVATEFVHSTPHIMLVPIGHVALAAAGSAAWISCAALLLSLVPTDAVPHGSSYTGAEAHGAGTSPGACNAGWPPGFAWKDEVDCDDCSASGVKCWRCAPPRYAVDPRFVYSLLSLLWHGAFLDAAGQCVVAGVVGAWFFAPRREKSGRASVWRSLRSSLGCHAGSLALGSLVLTAARLLRWWVHPLLSRLLLHQARLQRNCVAAPILGVLSSLLWCLENYVLPLDESAYIHVALGGGPFCASARSASLLSARSAARFRGTAALGALVRLAGTVCITLVTAIMGCFVLHAMYPEISPVMPTMAYALIGSTVAWPFMDVLCQAVNTALHCFMITEEMRSRPEDDFVPGALREFIESHDLQDEKPLWHQRLRLYRAPL